MPAFGCNEITRRFALRVKNEPQKGFRLSDRIVSALDRFIGALSRFRITEETLMGRWLFIYPFVGESDWTHALNLADVDGNFNKFKITWSGAVTHNNLGVTFSGDGQGNTNCDCADTVNNVDAWQRKSHGFYCRTNASITDRTMAASFTEPKNGYFYTQGIHAWWTDGRCYGDLVYYTKAGVNTTPTANRNSVVVGDSLGLYSDNQRSQYGGGPYHYMYKQGVLISSENTNEVGMGHGDGLGLAMMILSGPRNISFCFSTKYLKTLEGGAGPGGNAELNYFVHQLQIALQRNAY